MSARRCDGPLGPAVLADYWLRELAPGEEERVEEHLLGCETCSAELGGIARLGEGIRALIRKGALGAVVSDAFLERVKREGFRTREYRVPAGGRVACTLKPGDDLLVARLEAELEGVTRVDLVARTGDGPERRLPDVPVSAAAREVVFAERVDAARTLGPSVMRVRLLAVGEGGERLLGEYTFDHDPARPD